MAGDHDSTCIFCQIAAGEIPADIIAQSETALAFPDLTPQAPTHILVIPRRHIPALRHLTADDAGIAADLLALACKVAELEGLTANGYRVVTNDGPDAGQSVHHLHFHVLGGRSMTAPLA